MAELYRKMIGIGVLSVCGLFVTGFICSGTTVAAESSGNKLIITHVRLLFENGKPVSFVETGDTVQAYAVITYRGAGLFEGQWKVNGRLVSRLQKQLNGRRSFTVTTPEIPALPTEQLGSYRLEFMITSPPGGHTEPLLLLYHVTGQGRPSS